VSQKCKWSTQKREREREASLIDKEKSTYPQGKGRRNTKRGCPKSSPKSRQRLKSEREEKAPKGLIPMMDTTQNV